MFVFHCKWQVSQVCMCNRVKLCHVTSNIRSEKRFSKVSVTSSQQLLSPGIASIHPHFPILFLFTVHCVVFHPSCCGPHMTSRTAATNICSNQSIWRRSHLIPVYICCRWYADIPSVRSKTFGEVPDNEQQGVRICMMAEKILPQNQEISPFRTWMGKRENSEGV